MKMISKILVGLFVLINLNSFSQDVKEEKYELVFLAGMIQPILLQGGNFEVDFYTKKLVFNYSHGFSLDLNSELGITVGEIKEQNLAIHIPFSTGFGIGYRLNKYFDVRLEPKLHKFEIYYDGSNREKSINQITDYKTVTIGLGAYFRWKPFEKKENLLKGIFTSTSFRFWPKVYSSLDNNEISYLNRTTLKKEIHETSNIGTANTPFIFNFAVGYSILF